MKDYARNNFRQYNEENNLKVKPKKNRKTSKNRTRTILIFAVIFIIAVIIILSLFGIFSSKQTVNNMIQENQQTIEAPKTPEIFNTASPATDKIDTLNNNNQDVKSPIDAEQSTIKQTSLNSEDMQQIANEKLSENEVIITPSQDSTIENDNSPKFTFYNDLSNQEVESNAVENKAKKYVYTYMLQVGSYKDKESVDAIRARLLLIGLKPEVSKHGSWYRIDVGPVNSKREGDILRHKLEAAKISGSMLRQVSKTEVIEVPDQSTSEDKTN